MGRTGKLTPEDVAAIRGSDLSNRELGELFAMHPLSISHVRTGRNYKHLPGARSKSVGRPRTNFSKPCECGCRELTTPGKRYRQGHVVRVNPGAGFEARQGSVRSGTFLQRTFDNCLSEDRGYETACLIYQGKLMPNGYALTTMLGHRTTRHRVVYMVLHPDEDIDTRHIHHLCKQPDCMAPEHLLACRVCDHIRGHMSSLDQATVDLIRQRRKAGEKVKALAKEYGYSTNAMCAVINGRRWMQDDYYRSPDD